ncbi:mCG5072, partial [Mus musculus]
PHLPEAVMFQESFTIADQLRPPGAPKCKERQESFLQPEAITSTRADNHRSIETLRLLGEKKTVPGEVKQVTQEC